jgi:hypothetical protein
MLISTSPLSFALLRPFEALQANASRLAGRCTPAKPLQKPMSPDQAVLKTVFDVVSSSRAFLD